jgi:hypothetical protein
MSKLPKSPSLRSRGASEPKAPPKGGTLARILLVFLAAALNFLAALIRYYDHAG